MFNRIRRHKNVEEHCIESSPFYFEGALEKYQFAAPNTEALEDLVVPGLLP